MGASATSSEDDLLTSGIMLSSTLKKKILFSSSLSGVDRLVGLLSDLPNSVNYTHKTPTTTCYCLLLYLVCLYDSSIHVIPVWNILCLLNYSNLI